MHGFAGPASKDENPPVGVGIEVIDLPEGTIMIRVNEGIVVPFKSILSANQLRSYGTKVDDCPKMYGGTQRMEVNNGPSINLQYIRGLSYLPLRKPTSDKLSSLPIHDITSGMPWKPRAEETDLSDPPTTMKLILEDEHNDNNDEEYYNYKTITDTTNDLEHVKRCLGWKSDDVIKNTLKATTQLAQNYERLPMRMHFKSRFPALNVRRLREIFATDTFFSSEKAL